jgi:hypothetical protein
LNGNPDPAFKRRGDCVLGETLLDVDRGKTVLLSGSKRVISIA